MFLIYCLLWLLQPIIGNELNENKPILQEITLPKKFNYNQVVRLNCDLVQGAQPLQFDWYFKNIKLENNNKTKIYLIIKFPEGPASRGGLDPSKRCLATSAEDLGTFAQRNWGLLKQGWFCSQRK